MFFLVCAALIVGVINSDLSAADKGDLTGDSYVDMNDLAFMADAWLENNPRADIAPISGDPNVSISDGDGIVNNKDLALLAENWQDGSLTLSSNALDFALRQIITTEADLYSTWGTEKYPYQTTLDYSAWDLTHFRTDPNIVEAWTVGFWPGCLWYAYELTGLPYLKNQAILWSDRIEHHKTNTVFADHGFVFLLSHRHGYRLGGTECSDYKDVVIQAAGSLASRYNPIVGCIDAWDWNQYADKFVTIIDTMMNIEILFWAAKNGGLGFFYDFAVSHASKTRENHINEDGSLYHIVCYDENTGEVDYKQWCDKCSQCPEGVVWMLGEAWALYGFTMTYRETGDPNFLETAQKVADYFLDNLPADMVSCRHVGCDDNKDSSASAVAAAGLLELCTMVTDPCDQQRYYNAAEDILTSLSTVYLDGGYLCDDADVFILRDAAGVLRGRIFGDYYFVEALMRYYGMTDLPQ